MIRKIDITDNGISLSVEVDGNCVPIMSFGAVGMQTRDYTVDVIHKMSDDTYVRKAFKRYCLGEFDKEEEINMNKVLELYVEREEKRLREWYKLQEDTEYNNLDIVREFNDAEDVYVKRIEELRNKYNNQCEGYLIQKTGYGHCDMYELASRIRDEIHSKLAVDFDADMKSLHKKKEEVEALLSLSDDKDYQIEILTKYDILDKKGMIK